MSVGEDLLEERRRRRVGDPRLSEADREILRLVTRGDLQAEFQAARDADLGEIHSSAAASILTKPTDTARSWP